LKVRQDGDMQGVSNVKEFLPLLYSGNPYDYRNDSWYTGDSIFYGKRNMDDMRKKLVFFKVGKLRMIEGLRRVSQLVEYENLTKASQNQDRMFIEVYKVIFYHTSSK
jgi:hypothetical protein